MIDKTSTYFWQKTQFGLNHFQQKWTSLLKASKTVLLRQVGRSDIERWRRVQSLNESWDARTALLAKFIAPGTSVLEFGAGRLVLPQYLPPDCTYTPSDLVDRGPGTLVCDLNAVQLMPFPPHDVAVFSGVLEYIHDLERLVGQLACACTMVVASYAVTDYPEQARVITRRGHGWVNDYNTDELVALFQQHRFLCLQHYIWQSQTLFRFVQSEKIR
jgi:hypothetical protein